ncbi:MAG: tetratricopeptide repeat protein, partial [Candidatus Omnitrophica bacterium]|nr:tetratricopeptide repeat protein [Candidatus Omnitrophota bacterium]
MRFKIVFLLFCIFIHYSLFAFDWVNLHNKADTMSLEESVILIKESKSIEDIYIAGLVYLKYHKNREAIELFKKILNYQEVNYPAQWGIAEVLRRDNNLEESKKILNNIIYKNPDFSPAYISLA